MSEQASQPEIVPFDLSPFTGDEVVALLSTVGAKFAREWREGLGHVEDGLDRLHQSLEAGLLAFVDVDPDSARAVIDRLAEDEEPGARLFAFYGAERFVRSGHFTNMPDVSPEENRHRWTFMNTFVRLDSDPEIVEGELSDTTMTSDLSPLEAIDPKLGTWIALEALEQLCKARHELAKLKAQQSDASA